MIEEIKENIKLCQKNEAATVKSGAPGLKTELILPRNKKLDTAIVILCNHMRNSSA